MLCRKCFRKINRLVTETRGIKFRVQDKGQETGTSASFVATIYYVRGVSRKCRKLRKERLSARPGAPLDSINVVWAHAEN